MESIDSKRIIEESGIRHLSFYLGAEEFAIPLLVVKEVIAVPELRPMPFAPAYFLGIMNLRGIVIPVIDLAKKMQIPQTGAKSEEAVIICDLEPQNLGIRVDSVNSVVAPQATDLSPRPEVKGALYNQFVYGVYRRPKSLVLLLDVARALDSIDLESIGRVSRYGTAA